jgi:hypothetical protein
MEGSDHSDCPVELRACAEHADQDGPTAEVSPDAEEIDFSILSPERQQSRPHCECGCADADPGTVVGWCLWCGHGYVEYSPEIENRHFAHHCPGAPEEVETGFAGEIGKALKMSSWLMSPSIPQHGGLCE